MITNLHSGTNVHEIASGIYRINTPVRLPEGLGFNFNQYLIDDEAPLLFHTGPRRMFPLVQEAVAVLDDAGSLPPPIADPNAPSRTTAIAPVRILCRANQFF